MVGCKKGMGLWAKYCSLTARWKVWIKGCNLHFYSDRGKFTFLIIIGTRMVFQIA